MKRSKFIFSLILGFGLSAFAALVNADYRHAVSVYDSFTDYDDNVESSNGTVSYEFYFETIKSDDRPLAEAVFLQRASSITAAISARVSEYPGGYEYLEAGTGVEYTMLNSGSDFRLSTFAQVLTGEYNSSSGSTLLETDTLRFGLSLGMYLNETTSIDVAIVKDDYESSNSSYDTTDIFLFLKKLILMDAGSALNIEGHIAKLEYSSGNNTSIGASADYYFNKKLSIGGSFATQSGDVRSGEGKSIGVTGRIFFMENMSLAAAYSTRSADSNTGTDSDSLEIEFVARF